ncbi:hypothetical protein D3C80_929220 [compost metagenome]
MQRQGRGVEVVFTEQAAACTGFIEVITAVRRADRIERRGFEQRQIAKSVRCIAVAGHARQVAANRFANAGGNRKTEAVVGMGVTEAEIDAVFAEIDRGTRTEHHLRCIPARLVAQHIGAGIGGDATDDDRACRNLAWIAVERRLVDRTGDIETEIGVIEEHTGGHDVGKLGDEVAAETHALGRIVVAKAVSSCGIGIERGAEAFIAEIGARRAADLAEAAAAGANLDAGRAGDRW